jgi:hypothetical protein
MATQTIVKIMTDKTAQPKGLQTLLKISNALLLPFIGMVVFLALWSGVANNL